MTEQTITEDSRDRCLILVHGMDFKPDADDLLEFALNAMGRAVERDYPEYLADYESVPKRLCYYGDLTNSILTGMGKHYDNVLDLGDRRNAMAQMRLLDKRKQFNITRYDRLPGKTAVTEFAADVIAPLLNLLGFRKPLVARTAKDVAEYWYGENNYAESVRGRLLQQLTEALDKDERILLVSHGTGSIIAYDVLWQLSHDSEFAEKYAGRKIDTWVTLGSPLGDSLVRKQLFGARDKGREKYPGNILTWANLSAEDDYLCHDNTLADDFRPMLKQRLVSAIRDYKIYNLCVRYGKSNPHSSLGYYIHPRFGQILVEWLNSGPVEPQRPSTSQ
jgi:hypothetical protein